VLRALAEEPLHGYAIAQHIREISRERLLVEEGSLYPALYRMEKKGWIRSHWGLSDKARRARFYALSAEGRKQLAAERANWEALTDVMARILGQGE
jgi:transcriptional regulator